MNNLNYCKNEIKSRLDCREVFEFYGITANRSGFCSCPFHQERTPSCKVTEKGYHCFGCGESGDMIDLVKYLFNLTYKEAIEKLNTDFALGLPLDGQLSPAQHKRAILAQARQNVKKRLTDELEDTYWKLFDEEKRLKEIIETQKPEINGDCMIVTNDYIYAACHLPHIQFELDLVGGAINERKRNSKLY